MRSWINACVCILILFPAGAKADGSNYFLKGIGAIRYTSVFEKVMAGIRCKIDEDNWATALKFVANQSVKLKLIPNEEYSTREIQLEKKATLLFEMRDVSEQGMRKYEAAEKEHLEYVNVPSLFITITTIEVGSGCAGTLNGELNVRLASTKILATNVVFDHPTMEIWNLSFALRGPPQGFFAYGEQLIKKLVNDWAESQAY
jgi:hypothetical protein